MSSRLRIDTKNGNYSRKFSNWLSQLLVLIMSKNLYLIAGRGSSKTTAFLVERVVEMMYDLPGAPVCWVSDTYTNLTTNILPNFIAGLEFSGFQEGIHFVVEKAPPEFTDAEKSALPDWLKPYFWKPKNKIISYTRKIVFFTGFNITFGSLDRPSSLAGNSYVHLIGDEAKYFKEAKIANLLKAVRGYKELYGDSVFYLGVTFTTDMPNTANIGEYDWILKQGKAMNVAGILRTVRAGFILNECTEELLAAKERGNPAEILSKVRIYQRWKERHYQSRMMPDSHTFYCVASSYVNVDVLTPDYIKKAIEGDLGDTHTSILSMLPTIAGGDRFYCNLGERHFFYDGADDYWADYFGLRDVEDCRILKYLQTEKELFCGVDFGGRMNSLSVYQPEYNINALCFLKFLDALSPDSLEHLGDSFVRYFEPHKEKTLTIYYDRAGNSNRESKKDLISDLKHSIETYQFGPKKGEKTGWRVKLGSLHQGNIGQQDEYLFMQELFAGNNPRLPRIMIDAYQCKPLKCSLELAKTRNAKNAKGVEYITKDKRSEGLPVARLRFESTNPSDSFKYALMTKERCAIFEKRGGGIYVG